MDYTMAEYQSPQYEQLVSSIRSEKLVSHKLINTNKIRSVRVSIWSRSGSSTWDIQKVRLRCHKNHIATVPKTIIALYKPLERT